jgi:capsular polysaccharide biosynthesis protein
MELLRYLRIVARHRWIALSVFAITFGAVIFFSYSQDDFYESTSTYVVRPRVVESDDVIRAIDTLARGVEINATYAAIARSDQIEDRAKARFPDGEAPDIDSVDASVLTGTNLIEISVVGPDPEGVQAMNQAIGDEALDFVNGMGDVFQLQPLDAANLPRVPAGPNRLLTLMVGFVVSASLAVGVAVLAETIDAPPA